jgi:hypothetical protein
MRGAVLRFHGGMRQERHRVFGLDPFRGARERLGDISGLAPNTRFVRVEPAAHEVRDGVTRDAAVVAVVPGDRERVGSLLGVPERIGDDRDRILERHDLPHARQAAGLGVIDRLERPLEHRALHQRGVEHSGKLHIDAVGGAAQHLVGRVEPSCRLADERPVLGVLERDVRGRRHARGRFRDRAIANGAAARGVRHDASLRLAFGARNTPARSCRRDQHLARSGAGLAQHHFRIADRAAAAGRHVAIDAVAREAVVRSGELRAHIVPIASKLFGDQHGEPGENALAHLGFGDSDGHPIVGSDHDPGGDLGGGGCVSGAVLQIEAELEGAATRGNACKKRAAIEIPRARHRAISDVPRLSQK